MKKLNLFYLFLSLAFLTVSGQNAITQDYSEAVKNFMQPNFRTCTNGFGKQDVDIEKLVAESTKTAHNNVDPAKREAVAKRFPNYNPESFKQNEKTLEAIHNAVKESLDARALDIVRQQRLLASLCDIDEKGCVKCISREEASVKGISAEAYNPFIKMIDRRNEGLLMRYNSLQNNPTLAYAVYRIFFPDNLDNPDLDVLLIYPKK